MIGATLTTRLAQDGIDKKAVTAFSLAFLVYNLKWLWAWVVDGVHIPLLGRLGQRVSWLILAGLFVMAAVANLALVDTQSSLLQTAYDAVLENGRATVCITVTNANLVCRTLLEKTKQIKNLKHRTKI